MSILKSPIVKCAERLCRATKFLPTGLCYLCQQPANAPVCMVCEQDCLFFNNQLTNNNLLLWPSIKRGLTRGNYGQLCALSYYQWPLNYLVRQFKYGHPKLASLLTEWFIRYTAVSTEPLPDMLLPVPISPWRYAQRQYHQTLLLANQLGKQLNIAVNPGWAYRRGWQASQQSLGRRARLKNLRHAYQLHAGTLPERVAIVDDVVTTGATIAALSRMIYQHSPHTSISVWALAVTPVKADEQVLIPAHEINHQAVISPAATRLHQT